jgi:transposase-like protein
MDKAPALPKTLLSAVRFFADPENCRQFMVAMRWPDGVTCPRCGSKEVAYLANARVWKCRGKHDAQKFSAKVGTIMEDSPIGLDKWLPAIWLIVNCKNGVSSYEVHRALGITQKTAWFLLHRIRLAMQEGGGVLGGPGRTVEVDETWIGGKARKMNAKRRGKAMKGDGKPGPYAVSGKAIVFGMLERGGRVRLRHVPNVQRKTLEPHIREHVEQGTEIHSDANPSYDRLDWMDMKRLEQDYSHKVVDHAKTYVDGNVHTQGIENFWSLLKRAIRGTYVSVEPFHLFRYLDEQAFRFNERRATDGSRFMQAVRSIVGKRLTYQHLTGADAAAPT